MTIPEHLRFTLGGFSAKRVGYVLVALSFGFVPVHFYVSCEMSGLVAGFGIILFLTTAALSLFVPKGSPNRFRPLAFAFIAVVMHSLCTH
jgi:hypothetical protein